MRKLTTKWLIKRSACNVGVKWFKKSYPYGMIFTKKNINELVKKLLKRKRDFDGLSFLGRAVFVDSRMNLNFLIREMGDITSNSMYEYGLNTAVELAEAFWKDYKKTNK